MKAHHKSGKSEDIDLIRRSAPTDAIQIIEAPSPE